MSELIERQAAIDVLSVGKELLSRALDDMDVVGTDREKYSWGLGLIESNIKDIEELPSAQPEKVCIAKITLSEEQVREAVEKAKSEIVQVFPSAQPERKKGKWGNHGECPFCSYLRQWEDDKFCGNCGADMRGEQDG